MIAGGVSDSFLKLLKSGHFLWPLPGVDGSFLALCELFRSDDDLSRIRLIKPVG